MIISDNIIKYINLILILILVFFVIKGYVQGFIKQFFSTLTMIISLYMSWFFYNPFSEIFSLVPQKYNVFKNSILEDFFYKKSNGIVWFIILFVVSQIALKILAKVFNLISKLKFLDFFNKLFGVLFSVVNFLIIYLIITFVLLTPLFKNGSEVVDKTALKYNKVIVNNLSNFLNDEIEQLSSLQNVISNPKQASVEDIENFYQYFNKNKIDKSIVDKFIKELGSE